jgi:hypothetical protein
MCVGDERFSIGLLPDCVLWTFGRSSAQKRKYADNGFLGAWGSLGFLSRFFTAFFGREIIVVVAEC